MNKIWHGKICITQRYVTVLTPSVVSGFIYNPEFCKIFVDIWVLFEMFVAMMFGVDIFVDSFVKGEMKSVG